MGVRELTMASMNRCFYLMFFCWILVCTSCLYYLSLLPVAEQRGPVVGAEFVGACVSLTNIRTYMGYTRHLRTHMGQSVEFVGAERTLRPYLGKFFILFFFPLFF